MSNANPSTSPAGGESAPGTFAGGLAALLEAPAASAPARPATEQEPSRRQRRAPSAGDAVSTARVETVPLARDHRLDFWRGLCLVDMVLVHLVYEGVRMGQALTATFGEYLRFAAGGFIFLAGFGVSLVFLKKARDPARRREAYRALWRRSFYLLLVHYAASLSFVMIYPLRGFAGPYPEPMAYVRDVLLLRAGCDLLIFYVVMVAAAPAALELIRRGYWWVLAFLSVALFCAGQWQPHLLSFPIQQGFMVLPWQMIFVAGMLGGAALPRYDALGGRAKLALCAAAWAAVVTVACAAYGPLAERAWYAGIVFVKAPLSTGEALRYIGIIVTVALTSDLLWRWISGTAVVQFFVAFGQHSLSVYIAHIWVVALIAGAAQHLPGMGDAQVLFAIPAVAMLWAWVQVLDRLDGKSAAMRARARVAAGLAPAEDPAAARPEPALAWLARFAPRWLNLGGPAWRLSGAGGMAIAILFALHLAMPGGPRESRHVRLLAVTHVTPPTNLAGVVDESDYDAGDVLPDLPNEDTMPDDAEV